MSKNDLNLYEREVLYVSLYEKRELSEKNSALLRLSWKQRITYSTSEILRRRGYFNKHFF